MPPRKELKHAATKERAITIKHKRKQTREKKSEQIFVGHTEKNFLMVGVSIFLSVTTLNVNSTVLRGKFIVINIYIKIDLKSTT